MERYERRFTNPVLIWGSGLVLGVLFGLIILGWWLFPVVWVDASPSDLLYDYQVETLHATIEAYGYNSDVGVAKMRYDSLGENKETALSEIVQNPGSIPPALVESFSVEVAGVPASQLAAQPIEEPKTNTGLNTWVAIIGAILFLAVGGLLTYLILRGRDIKAAESFPEEPVAVMEPPTEEYVAPVETETEAVETVITEPITPEETRYETLDLETAEQPLETTPQEGLDLPPFLTTAGVAAAGLAAAEYERSQEDELEAAEQEEPSIAEVVPEDLTLPEAELEEFPFEEITPEEEPSTPDEAEADQFDSTPGGAGAAFATTAILASELFEGEPAEGEAEIQAIEIPTEAALEAPEIASEGTAIDEEEQTVQAHDPVEIKMRKRLSYIEGIGPVYAEMLAQAGIETTGKLLVEGVSRKGRKDIADRTGISERLVLEWVNHVDLYRVKGVGSEYADLLEATGVDTIPELAQRRADHLYQSMLVVNEQKRLVRQMPTEQHVADWIEQAKQLPRIIQY